MRLFGHILPFIGWRQLTPEMVEALAAESDLFSTDNRYTAFSIEWLGFGFFCNVKEFERTNERDV